MWIESLYKTDNLCGHCVFSIEIVEHGVYFSGEIRRLGAVAGTKDGRPPSLLALPSPSHPLYMYPLLREKNSSVY